MCEYIEVVYENGAYEDVGGACWTLDAMIGSESRDRVFC